MGNSPNFKIKVKEKNEKIKLKFNRSIYGCDILAIILITDKGNFHIDNYTKINDYEIEFLRNKNENRIQLLIELIYFSQIEKIIYNFKK